MPENSLLGYHGNKPSGDHSQTQNGSTSTPKVVPSSNNNINDMHTFNRSCLWKSEAVVALFHRINCCLPPDAGSFAKKLLDVFFSEEQLARSCCTKAVGRELLNQSVLCGIKCKLFDVSVTIRRVCTLFSVDRPN